MPLLGWLREAAKWGLGTALGVALTLVITSYFERASPSAEIAQISISDTDAGLPSSQKRIVSVPLNEELFTELAQSAWTESFRDPSDIQVKVISKLNRNKEYIESYLRHAQSYRDLREKMTLLLNGEKSPKAAEHFFDYWQQVDGFIYGSVRSQMRYGSSALRQMRCEQEAPELYLRKFTFHKDPDAQYFAKLIADIRSVLTHSPFSSTNEPGAREPTDSIVVLAPPSNREMPAGPDDSGGPGARDEHIYSVSKIGGKYKSRFDIRSNLDENEIITSREETCAEHVMGALADFDKERLNAILDITDQEAKSFELHRKIQSDIEKYIKGYSWWNVTMLISNKGKNPISFSPNATLYVDLAGTAINGGNNLAVSLKAMNKDGGDSDALTVPGGESRSVNFASSDLVKDYGDWKSVIDVFGQSSRNSIVLLYPQTGDWQQNRPLFSPIKNFGPPTKTTPKEAQDVSAHLISNRR